MDAAQTIRDAIADGKSGSLSDGMQRLADAVRLPQREQVHRAALLPRAARI